MGRKVFISFLGNGFYSKSKYGVGEYLSTPTRFIQEATLNLINVAQWDKEDEIVILLTDEAKRTNWIVENNYRENKRIQTREEYIGLKETIDSYQFQALVKTIDIENGENDDQMWSIFSNINNELKDGDELYLDLTHGFRYLPMLLLVLCNYAKFLKGASVKHISYGNFEGRKNDISPIIDLLPLSVLQDWTAASAIYLENGDAKKLVKLCDSNASEVLKLTKGQDMSARDVNSFAKGLDNFVNTMRTCRGFDIISGQKVIYLNNIFNQIEKTYIEPLNPILIKIKNSLNQFNKGESVLNGLEAAKWCYNNGLYQQSITILNEFIVSLFCDRNNIDKSNEDERKKVNEAFDFIANTLKTNKNKKNISTQLGYRKISEATASIIKDNLMTIEMVHIFTELKELRNDINHSGIRTKKAPIEPQKLIFSLSKIIEAVDTFIINIKSIDNDNKYFINVSNHPSCQWSNEQITAAEKFGKIVDIPFPIVETKASKEDIDNIARDLLIRIRGIASSKQAQIHIMGEMTLTFALLLKLKTFGYTCYAATSNRDVILREDGVKEVIFKFEKFREYI